MNDEEVMYNFEKCLFYLLIVVYFICGIKTLSYHLELVQ